MDQNFPAGKILKLSIIISPFFGLFTAVPPLGRIEPDYQRILLIFCLFTLLGFCCWMVNLLLYRYVKIENQKIQAVARYTISFLSIVALTLVFDQIFRKLVPPILLLPNGTSMHLSKGMHLPKGMPMPPRINMMFMFPLMRGLAMNVFILILFELVLLRERKTSIETENALLKLAHSEARNALLQRQLNPHFLFNSLSTLRSLIKRSTANAESYIEKLSDMLRFSIHNTVKSIVPLGEEIDFCKYYLDLQKMRFGEALVFFIDIPDNLKEKTKVPTFSLQLLVENAIKHNVLTKEAPLHITITAHPDNNQVAVQHNHQPKSSAVQANETGLQNLSERYRLLNAPPIHIDKSNNFFTVKISLI